MYAYAQMPWLKLPAGIDACNSKCNLALQVLHGCTKCRRAVRTIPEINHSEGALQSLRMQGSNLSEFSELGGGSHLSEFQNEGGSNLSELDFFIFQMH